MIAMVLQVTHASPSQTVTAVAPNLPEVEKAHDAGSIPILSFTAAAICCGAAEVAFSRLD
jgi:hypothetical protein